MIDKVLMRQAISELRNEARELYDRLQLSTRAPHDVDMKLYEKSTKMVRLSNELSALIGDE